MKPNRNNTTENTPKNFWEKTAHAWGNKLTHRGREVVAAGLATTAIATGFGVAEVVAHNDHAAVPIRQVLNEQGETFVNDVANDLGTYELTSTDNNEHPDGASASRIDYENHATKITIDDQNNTATLVVVNHPDVGASRSAAATYHIPDSLAEGLVTEIKGDGVDADELRQLAGQTVQRIGSSTPAYPDQVAPQTTERIVDAMDGDGGVLVHTDGVSNSMHDTMTAQVDEAVAQFEDVTAHIVKP